MMPVLNRFFRKDAPTFAPGRRIRAPNFQTKSAFMVLMSAAARATL